MFFNILFATINKKMYNTNKYVFFICGGVMALKENEKLEFNYLALDSIDIKRNLNNLMGIYNFLDELANCLEYKLIHKPVLIPYYHGKVPKDCGISCYAFFEQGGYLTLHIFEKRRIAYFDIVYKEEIDEQKIIAKVSSFVGSKKYNLQSSKTIPKIYNKNVFGPHYFCWGEMLKEQNLDSLIELQNNIITGIGMTPIINPVIVKNKTTTTLFIAIAESHIVLTLSKSNLRVDIFSCKMFDTNKLTKIIKKVLNVNKEILFTRMSKVDNDVTRFENLK